MYKDRWSLNLVSEVVQAEISELRTRPCLVSLYSSRLFLAYYKLWINLYFFLSVDD